MRKLRILVISTLLFSTLLPSLPVRAEELSLSAEHAVLYEPTTDTVLYGKGEHLRAPMASTTKIMTAYVAFQHGNLSDIVSIPAAACGIEGSSIYLQAGESLSLEDLLYALLLQSANDAATAIALHIGGSLETFSNMMNESALALGLTNTHFVNPHGLDDPEHYTTAYDLAKITSAAMERDDFCRMVSTIKHSIPKGNAGDVRILVNHNKLLRMYDHATGVKTGFTKKSGRCLVGAAEQNGLSLISVTLDAPNDWNDHKKLLDFGFSKMENRLLCDSEAFSFALPVWGRNETALSTNKEAAHAILPKDAPPLEYTIDLPHHLTAPLKHGRAVGSINFIYEGRIVSSVPLVIK